MQLPAQLLTPGEHVVLVSHVRPDGDAVGSLLGLRAFLLDLGWHQVSAVLQDGCPAALTFLPGSASIVQELPEGADYCVLLDANEVSRSGFTPQLQRYAARTALLVIDHHLAGEALQTASWALHDTQACSTCELVHRLAVACGWKITAATATCLLIGIYTDTGGFQHSNTSNQTLELSAELMRRGGNLGSIVRHVSQSKSIGSLRLLGLALERVRLTKGGTVAVSVLTMDDITATGATPDDVSGIIGHLSMLPGISCCILLSEFASGQIRGSIRSGEPKGVDVERIAKLLGGGGHRKAAGFSLSGHILIQDFRWEIVAQSVTSR